jgi:tetratricopeptide (TPR) repeat protein
VFSERLVTTRRTLHAVSFALVLCLLRVPIAAAELRTTQPDEFFTSRFRELEKELTANIATPRAAATLYRLASLTDELPDLAALADLFARTASHPKASGDVKQLARAMLVNVRLAQGRADAAEAELQGLAFAREGWVIGGFDNEGGTGHKALFGPEQNGLDLKATYQGKEREISWRRLPALGPNGRIPVADLVRPTKNVSFYFLTSLEAPGADRAVLHFGTSGATKLWLNGQLIAEDADDHPARLDQRSLAVPLRKGSNTVLLKVSTLDEVPAVYLRASAMDGSALAKAKFVAPSPESLTSSAGSVTLAREVTPALQAAAYPDLTSQLAKLVEKSPKDAALREDYAMLLDERRPFDSKVQKARREQEVAAKLSPKNALTQSRLARLIEDDHNLRRQAFDAALSADPKFAPARTQLARHYLDRGLVRRGYDEAVRAAADMPGYVPGQLGLSSAMSTMGLEARARRLELQLAEQFPQSPSAQLAAARSERTLGRYPEALARYLKVIELRSNHMQARAELSSMLLDSGDLEGALAQLEASRASVPTSTALGLRIADLMSNNGRAKDALALYDRLQEVAPDDETILEARGQHQLRQGDTRAALADFSKAIAIKPQNPRLRELMRAVQPQDNFARPYLRDAVALAKANVHRMVSPDEDTLVLAQVVVTRVYPNGLSSVTRQLVAKAVTDRGVESLRGHGVYYSPGEKEVKVEASRVIKRDGSIVEAKSENDQQISDSYSGMYFDRRQRTVVFPTLEKGDVVEFTYREDDVSQQNMFADYFGDVEYLQGTSSRLDTEFVLIAPPERTFYWNEPTLPNVKQTRTTDKEGRQVLRWQATDVPRIDPEPKMPGWANVAAYLHVSTFKEWDDVAKFWWGLVKEQLHVTPEVAQAAEEAVAGVPSSDVNGRVRAVYNYVVTKTRYVGLEFGIHGFKPYKVDRILARRFGDCKDKASLMYAMLSHLGIDSRLVLLRMRHLGQLDPKPASLAVFNHAILYVPSLNLYLDGTAEFSGSSELPGSDQGAQVLVIESEGKVPSKLALTPVSVPAENVTSSQVRIALASDGSASMDGKNVIRGVAAQGYRRAYESETGRKERFEQNYSRSYPGAKVGTFEMSEPRAIEKPVETKYALSVPRLGRVEGGNLLFSPLGEPWRFAESNAPLSKRQYTVELGAPWRNEFSYDVALPAGYAVVDAPVQVEKTSPFGSYQYVMKPSPTGITVSGHIAFTVSQVTPDQYGAFRSFLEEVDRTFSRRFRLSQATASITSEAAR